MRDRARVVQVGRDDLALLFAAAAVRCGQRRAALLRIPWHQTALGGARYGQRPNGIGVAVTVAVVVVLATVARRPDENAAPAVAALRDALDERTGRELAGTVDRFAVVVGTPANCPQKKNR